MNLSDFLQAPRKRTLGFMTLTPPDPSCLTLPAVRQAVRNVVAGTVTRADYAILSRYWMAV